MKIIKKMFKELLLSFLLGFCVLCISLWSVYVLNIDIYGHINGQELKILGAFIITGVICKLMFNDLF
jgi:hypothetical protein